MTLYRVARTYRTLKTVGHPRAMAHRARTIITGRLLAQIGFWRFLWGGRR